MGSLLTIFFWNQGAAAVDAPTFQVAWATGSNVIIIDGAESE